MENARHYRHYTDDDIICCAAEVRSIAELLKRLGLRPAGGNYHNIKKNLQRLNVDCSHWKGQAWNRDEQLKDWSDYHRAANLKPHLLRERGHRCERCGNELWMGEPIALEVHHIDGDRTNNNVTNLQLCCPNCHALTETWKGRNKKSTL